MNEIIQVIAGFIIGEVLLLVLVHWLFSQLRAMGILEDNPPVQRMVLLLFSLIPIAIAAFILPGIVSRLQAAQAVLPATGRVGTLTATANQTPLGTGLAGTGSPAVLATAAPTQAAIESSPAPIATAAPPSPTAPPAPPPTSSGPAPTQPSPGSAGPTGKIVYVCQLFLDTTRDQLCLVNADGSGQRRVTQVDTNDYNFPVLSPDGQMILYAGNDAGQFNIFESDLDGNARQLTNGPGDSFAPDYSPDGAQIVFTSKQNERSSLLVMNRDGSAARPVPGLETGNQWEPAWSPDGSRILFASDRAGTVQLFSIAPDGSGLQQVTDLAGLLGGGDWSPGGQQIAVYAGPSWNREISTLGLDDSSLRQLTQGGNNLSPSFSPDGQWLAFTSYRDLPGDENGCEIYIMREDGSQVKRLTNNDYCDWQPRWGP